MATTSKRKRNAKHLKLLDTHPELAAEPQPPITVPIELPKSEVLMGISREIITKDPWLRTISDSVTKMAAIGELVELTGTLRVGNGQILATQTACLEMIEKVRESAKDAVDPIPHARAIGYVGTAVARLSKEFRSQNDSSPHKAPRRNNSFSPGAKVELTQHNIHIHTNDATVKDH